MREQPQATGTGHPQLPFNQWRLTSALGQLRQREHGPASGPRGWLAAELGGFPVALLRAAEPVQRFEQHDPRPRWDASNQNTVSAARINTLICPSESVKTGPWIASTWTNYHANMGGPASMYGWTGPIVPMNGNYGNSGGHANIPEESAPGSYTPTNLGTFGFESITDGLSNTACFSEALIGYSGYVNVPPGQKPGSLAVPTRPASRSIWTRATPWKP